MAEALVYKPRMDLSNNLLFRLSLYYMYVSLEFTAPLLNHSLSPEASHGNMYSQDVFQSSLYTPPQTGKADSEITIATSVPRHGKSPPY